MFGGLTNGNEKLRRERNLSPFSSSNDTNGKYLQSLWSDENGSMMVEIADVLVLGTSLLRIQRLTMFLILDIYS
jgi:hypothetical protein